MTEIVKVYVDMDGVLSDFDSRVSEILGKDISAAKSSEIWNGVHKYNMDVAPFYETLEQLPDAKLLWDFVINNFPHVEILTATGYTPKDAATQKRQWCEKNLKGYKAINTVKSSGDKAKFADPSHILIDDRPHSIDPWINAGGIGVFHNSTSETIQNLKQFL